MNSWCPTSECRYVQCVPDIRQGLQSCALCRAMHFKALRRLCQIDTLHSLSIRCAFRYQYVFGMAELASITIALSGVVWHCESMNSWCPTSEVVRRLALLFVQCTAFLTPCLRSCCEYELLVPDFRGCEASSLTLCSAHGIPYALSAKLLRMVRCFVAKYWAVRSFALWLGVCVYEIVSWRCGCVLCGCVWL
jgi:hypothetical protein